jgi:site-specific DNA recombinase
MAEKILKCAIYTRKSTEDGLLQEFNSLDAQYEACAAYALSQRHEGWTMVPERYDDGGFSGGNMDRPALQRLLADVASGKVDIILLYKIDRLTRSLADFAKIVEVLDKAGASFVSITQSFNTTTSMGRLTLNMMLSFAQFEREVTGERIRDKIAASKRKGMWMGGPVPLGYAVDNRKLVVVPEEAELVREIMQRYLKVPSVPVLAEELNAEGYRTKVQNRTSGPHRGGCIFRRGTLYHLLANPIYRGKIVHKGELFEGEHEAIVSLELWEDVQATLRAKSSGSSKRSRFAQPSLLVGLLTDGEGRAMTPTHAVKPGKRYRYYVTRQDQLDGEPAWRVSAHDIEKLVCDRVAGLLTDQQSMLELAANGDAQSARRMLAEADLVAARLRSGSVYNKASLLEALCPAILLQQDAVQIRLDRARLADALGVQLSDGESIAFTCPATRVRRGHQLRLVIPGPDAACAAPINRDMKLVKLLAEASEAKRLVMAAPGDSVATIAARAGRCRARMAKLLPVACLDPGIVKAIVEGRQPLSLTARSLLDMALPLAWSDQRRVLGFS